MIFLISDIHSYIDRFDKHINNITKKINRELDERDIIICLGDLFGQPKRKAKTWREKKAADEALIKHIEQFSFDVLCIYGNHDNRHRLWNLKSKSAEWNNQDVNQVGENIFYLDNGGIYNIPFNATKPETSAIKVLALGGAFSHLYRLRGAKITNKLAYLKQYLHIIHSPKPIEVDYILAHDAPSSKLGLFVSTVFGVTPVNNVLENILDNTVFYDWYFGHHHFDLEPKTRFHCIYNREVQIIPETFKRCKYNEELSCESYKEIRYICKCDLDNKANNHKCNRIYSGYKFDKIGCSANNSINAETENQNKDIILTKNSYSLSDIIIASTNIIDMDAKLDFLNQNIIHIPTEAELTLLEKRM